MDTTNLILKCSGCSTKNKLPLSRIDDAPKCGKCGALLPTENLGRTVDITDATFDQEVLAATLPVLVDCWAPWCGPCRAVGPVLDDLARTYRGRLKIAKLNLDENPIIGSRYSISSVPTMLLVKDGQVIDKLIGALPKEQRESQIERVL